MYVPSEVKVDSRSGYYICIIWTPICFLAFLQVIGISLFLGHISFPISRSVAPGRPGFSVSQVSNFEGWEDFLLPPASVYTSICLLALRWPQPNGALDWSPPRKCIVGMEKEKFLNGSGHGGGWAEERKRCQEMPHSLQWETDLSFNPVGSLERWHAYRGVSLALPRLLKGNKEMQN